MPRRALPRPARRLRRCARGPRIGTSSGGSSRTMVSPNRSPQPPKTPVLPASRSTTVRRHTPRTPSSASCARDDPCAAWNRNVSTAVAVAPRHADDCRGAARRRQRHEQLAGRGVLDGERQLELARRAVAFDGELARQRRVLERRERDGRGLERRRSRGRAERRPRRLVAPRRSRRPSRARTSCANTRACSARRSDRSSLE